jgi:hypothetical protein
MEGFDEIVAQAASGKKDDLGVARKREPKREGWLDAPALFRGSESQQRKGEKTNS